MIDNHEELGNLKIDGDFIVKQGWSGGDFTF
jgi:hypothetical protein